MAPADRDPTPVWSTERGSTQRSSPTRAAKPRPDLTFIPGALLAERYRIIGLLGRGGMGSVYRAEDLVLGEDVALKFLAEGLVDDEEAVGLLRNEVAVSRRVTHTNVCRVHDVGEVDDRPFLSMEYVDGEDLSSLLRRVGRMTGERAVQIARQLCAGLHAAHEQGVLHRDLKPANVLIDRDGTAHIADFGIAAAIEGAGGTGAAGSPAYMAPELFAGADATRGSDIYSLGLVLFELFVGKPLHDASSMTELVRAHRRPVRLPTEFVPGLDRSIEQVILRCLERDPDRRPQSALAVLAALPGGDPLAAALASGETPSLELVANAGGTGVLSQRVVVGLLAFIVGGLALAMALEDDVKLLAQIDLPKAPAVLADRAQELLRMAGQETEDVQSANGFELDRLYLDEIEARGADHAEWRWRLASPRPAPATFWYRQTTESSLRARNIKGRVTWSDPPPFDSGSARVRLDPRGRLLDMLVALHDLAHEPTVAPDPESTPTDANEKPIDWQPWFDAAGLDAETFEAVDPARIPPVFADRRVAWVGEDPENPGRSIRVEGASCCGMPVAFRVLEQRWPDADGARGEPERVRTWRYAARVLLLVVAAGLAWSTLRRRRGDLRGASWLGMTVFGGVVAFTVLSGDHGADWNGLFELVFKGMSHGLLVAGELCLYYIAFEPHARRVWPETLIAWTRLTAGGLGDPLVGRSVLIGVALGVLSTVIGFVQWSSAGWFGPPSAPLSMHPASLGGYEGLGSTIGASIEIVIDVSRESLKIFMALVVLRLVIRNPALTTIAMIAIWSLVWRRDTALSTDPATFVPFLIEIVAVAIVALSTIRFGLLSLVCGFTTFSLAASFPLRPDLSSWHAASTIYALALIGVLALAGARVAREGRPG